MTRRRTALHRVSEGYVEPTERTFEGADEVWCRIAARGKIVARAHDSRMEQYRVHLTVIEHPDLPDAQVYAVFGMGQGTLSVYRCLPEDAHEALRDPGAFNL